MVDKAIVATGFDNNKRSNKTITKSKIGLSLHKALMLQVELRMHPNDMVQEENTPGAHRPE